MNVVNVDIGASRLLRVVFSAAIIFALLCLVFSGLSGRYLILALFVWGVVVCRTWWVAVGPHRCVSVQRESSGRWSLTFGSGANVSAMLRPGGCYVQNWVVILCFRVEGQWSRRYVAIFRDSVESESFRRLRVYLRWYVLAD